MWAEGLAARNPPHPGLPPVGEKESKGHRRLMYGSVCSRTIFFTEQHQPQDWPASFSSPIRRIWWIRLVRLQVMLLQVIDPRSGRQGVGDLTDEGDMER